jgi:hypothetical protein
MWNLHLGSVPLVLGRLQHLSLPRRSFVTGGRRTKFCWDDYSEYEIKSNCRFRKEHFEDLRQALELPMIIRTGKRDKAHAYEALIIFLYRLSFPGTWDRTVPLVGYRCRTACTRIFYHLVDHVYTKFARCITDVSKWASSVPEFAKKCTEKGSVFANVFAFMDGTFDEMCRPGGGRSHLTPQGLQGVCYNGHYKDWGLKYNALLFPNGMYGDIYGARESLRRACGLRETVDRRNTLRSACHAQVGSRVLAMMRTSTASPVCTVGCSCSTNLLPNLRQ